MAIVPNMFGWIETGVNVVNPANCQNQTQATRDMVLLGYNYSLELLAPWNTQLAIPEELIKQKYDQGNITK